MKVWTFWTGEITKRIETCLATIEKACTQSQWQHLDMSAAEKVLDGKVDPVWRRLIPAHQADVLRACVLAQYGGLWVDADTVMFRDPVEYFGHLDKFAYTTWDNPPLRAINGYVYSPRPNHPVALDWFSRVSTSLSEMNHWDDAQIVGLERTNWTRFGEKCLTPALTEEGSIKYPRNVFLPLDLDLSSPKFFEDLDWTSFVKPATIGFGLSNSYIEVREHKIKPDTLICRLMEFAERYKER